MTINTSTLSAKQAHPKACKLKPEQLYTKCKLSVKRTSELGVLDEIIGQERALKAIDFGLNIQHKGYNLFVLGSEGIGKTALVKKLLKTQYSPNKPSYDLCYINNFEYPQHPKYLQLPAGMAKPLSESMEKLLKLISELISAAFQSDEYVERVQEIDKEINEKSEKQLKDLIAEARKNDVAVIRTPSGYTLSAVVNNEIVDLQEFKQLSEKEQAKRNKLIEEFQNKLHDVLGKIPLLEQKAHEELDILDKDIATQLVTQAMANLYDAFNEIKSVTGFLDDVKEDIINHLDEFYEEDLSSKESKHEKRKHISKTANFHRYLVNVLVDHSATEGAPIIFEDNPTYSNLLGRIEYLSTYNAKDKEETTDNALGLGNLLTAFTLIKSGSLHKANHGYLLIDAENLLINPYAWDGLKRALKSSQLSIEPLDELHGFSRYLTLEPQAIPLNAKIILIGDRNTYHLLKNNDPEFNKLFKVNVDFSEEFSRSENNVIQYAKLVIGIQRQEKTSELSVKSVERIIEHASRMVDSNKQISLHIGDLRDLILEAEYFHQLRLSQREKKPKKKSKSLILPIDIQQALDARSYRDDQYREKVYEDIIGNIILIDTEDKKIGQVNGLSVLQIGEFSFGQPSRITATVRVGDGGIVDIEREVDLGGDLHSKGVMILTAYLAHFYAKKSSLSLDATLTFEQNYGLVDGDSASIAELTALLSAIAEIPINQAFAVTGSINQLGEVQAIGGVNEKIEGFFSICKKRGLTGKHSVIIPHSNVSNLMLNQDVVQACKEGLFNIYAVSHVQQAMSLLMGLPAGKLLKTDGFTKDSINDQIMKSLEAYSLVKHNEQHKYDKNLDIGDSA